MATEPSISNKRQRIHNEEGVSTVPVILYPSSTKEFEESCLNAPPDDNNKRKKANYEYTPTIIKGVMDNWKCFQYLYPKPSKSSLSVSQNSRVKEFLQLLKNDPKR